MPKETKHILRVVDVNFNRCKEGLRVIEDIFRFILENDSLRRKIRSLRHGLDFISRQEPFKKAILSRNSKADIGEKCDNLEMKRVDVNNVLYINFQRIKESLRVLEEFFKLAAPNCVSRIKKTRYEIYTLEKETIKLRPPLRDSR